MNNQLTIYPQRRKANCKKWRCPFTGKEINTRGVPAYLRNKYGLPWDKKFLSKPEIVLKKYKQKSIENKLARLRYFIWLFSRIDDKFKTMVLRMDKEMKDYSEEKWQFLKQQDPKEFKIIRDMYFKFRFYLNTKPDLFDIVDD